MTDMFSGHVAGLDSPFEDGVAVSPSDTIDLPGVSRALWIGTMGDVCAVTRAGTSLTFRNVSGLLSGRFTRVKATGTTASDIVAVW
jgi:hypothetical protein